MLAPPPLTTRTFISTLIPRIISSPANIRATSSAPSRIGPKGNDKPMPAPQTPNGTFTKERPAKKARTFKEPLIHTVYSHEHPLLVSPVLSQFKLPKALKVTYTTSPAAVDAFLSSLPELAVVGIDTETRPQFQKGGKGNPPSTLQLATETEAIIIHLRRHSRSDKSLLTPALRAMLASPRVLKVGVGAANDGRGLAEHWDLEINGCIDIDIIAQYFTGAKIFGETKHEKLVRLERERLLREESTSALSSSADSDSSGTFDLESAVSSAMNPLRLQLPGYGLRNLSNFFLSHALPKPKKVQLSNWEAAPLRMEQTNYAASDAWVSLILWKRLADLSGSQNLRTWEPDASRHGHFY